MHPSTTHERAAQLLESGMSASSVARALGLPVSTVTTWRRRGFPSAMRSTCPVEDGQAQVLPQGDYSALLGFYLGDGCISAAGRTTMLRIACDRTYPGIIADAKSCI